MILFIIICIIVSIILYSFRKVDTYSKISSIEKPTRIIKCCEELYLQFTISLWTKNFYNLKKICSYELLTSIVAINNLTPPINVFFRQILSHDNVIKYNTTNDKLNREKYQIIKVEFLGNTPNGLVQDLCVFSVNQEQKIQLIQFNDTGSLLV